MIPLKGSMCALVTPFRDGDVDFAAFRRLVEWHIENGTHGLVPCGTTGETPCLTADEKAELIRICVETARGRVPVIAGTGSNAAEAAIAATRQAKSLGADAALIVTPYYNKPGQAGLIAHFSAIHDATDIPIVLYNVPGRTSVDMSVETVTELSQMPRIIGIKDASADLARVSRQRLASGPDFLLISGEDATALGFNAHGGVGCISVTANVAPALCAQLQEATLAGDFAKARDIQDRLMPLHQALFIETSPSPAKYALSVLGLTRDEMRLPLIPASKTARAAVDAALAHAGLKAAGL